MNSVTCPLADAYVRSVNHSDAAAYLACFADDAVVDDAGRVFHGRDAIQAWAASDIFAVNVRFEVLDVAETPDGLTLTTKVDGDFDRTGLPDPVVINHHIEARDGQIHKLTCSLAD